MIFLEKLITVKLADLVSSVAGSVSQATALVEDLRENHHIFCSMVVYPVVPQGTIMLRLIPTAVHTFADVYKTVAVFTQVRQNLAAGKYASADTLLIAAE